jgi:3-methyladenine DNA glycosylase AlkD
MKRPSTRSVLEDLRACAIPEKAAFFPKFFQAFPGGYGEGDQFLGVTVPNIRLVAKTHASLSRPQVLQCLRSPWHECRMAGLFILIRQFEVAKADPVQREVLVDFYVEHLDHVNNWDLVDCSAYKLLGAHVVAVPKQRNRLERLARSGHLWRERVAIVATLAQIRNHDYADILQFAERFLQHPHDLIHKAVGWMLREMGRRDEPVLRAFLDEHAAQMPRTMLRYSLEKLEEKLRSKYMHAKRHRH